jgi:ferredoxin
VRSAISVPWAPRYKSLLELAEGCDVPTRWSCRTGVCHNCETVRLAVQVGYDFDRLVPPPKATSSFHCISTPSEDVVLDL